MHVPPLRFGRCRIAAEAPSFERIEKTLVATVGERLILDFELPVQGSRTVEAVADTPVQVNRENAAVSTLFTRELIQDLPLNGRSFQSSLELTPGAVLAPASISSRGQFAVNGQRTNPNYFMVGGVSANVAASASAAFTRQPSETLPGFTTPETSSGLVSIGAVQQQSPPVPTNQRVRRALM